MNDPLKQCFLTFLKGKKFFCRVTHHHFLRSHHSIWTRTSKSGLNFSCLKYASISIFRGNAFHENNVSKKLIGFLLLADQLQSGSSNFVQGALQKVFKKYCIWTTRKLTQPKIKKFSKNFGSAIFPKIQWNLPKADIL